MPPARVVDTHCHIIDPVRFPFADGPGYKPRPEEAGTADEFCQVLNANGVAHAVLVQPSGYGYDNSAAFDAMRRNPGRFRTIAVLDPATPMCDMVALAEKGVVGVRFNLQSFRADALLGRVAERFLEQLKELDWFAQVFADDNQWAEAAPILRRSGLRILVDHFGLLKPELGLDQPGFNAVLAMGRDGLAFVKFSAPFRVSNAPNFANLDQAVDALLVAFTAERCLWGSDWPFINFPQSYRYDFALRAVQRWLPDLKRRRAVLWDNPIRLFGFATT
jgi:predicted TIM-barrel fold metal-dependent hydrolase